MREIDRIFTLLCIVLSNEYSNEIVNTSLVELNALVTGKIELQQENVVNFEDDYEPSDDSITYRLKSPFGRHFDILKRNNCARSKIFKGNKLNTCYSLEILEYLLTYYMPILPLWTGVILSKSCDESKASNPSAENWFRIVKHPILETKVNVRAGDFIRTMYDNIHDRISAFNFGFHPLAPKIFKSRKRKLEIQNEEDSKEKWCRRSKCQKSYINPNLCRVDKVFEAINVVNKFERKSLKKRKNSDFVIPRKKRIIDRDLVPCVSSDVVLPGNDVEIITDLDIIELCTLNYDLPHYIPLSHTGRLDICNTLQLNVRVSLGTNSLNSHIHKPLNYYIPSRTHCIPGDGNCLFSSLAYSVTSCSDNCHIIRKCILDGMSSSLKEKCGKFINNKYPNTYRNTIDYINKTNMKNNGVWGGDLELFTAGLLFNTDIWVYSKETGNSVFSGKGASIDKVLNSPPANMNGSI